jgi:hypothetical protein
MPNLDPHPLNELGRGIFPPDQEAKLLAAGAVFARTVRMKSGKSFIDCYFRPFLQTIHEQEVSAFVMLEEAKRRPIRAKRQASS